MKAIVQDRYGLDAVHLADVDVPRPRKGEVLIRVRAASGNPADVAVATGLPRIMRLAVGLRRPKARVRGIDLAGVIEAVGAGVTSLQPGDEVYGQGEGTFAEFAIAPERHLAAKPANLSFEEAASVPMVGLVALHAVRDRGRIGAGQKVLVTGAGGGIGTFAVQLARAYGAEVTGVCSAGKVELVQSLGADRVVDYTKDDFLRTDERYDLILDNVSSRPLRSLRRLLTKKGLLLMNGGEFDHHWIGPMGRFLRWTLISPFGRGRIATFLSLPNQADLLALKELIEAGKAKPVIGRTFALAEAPAAIAAVAAGHSTGKVVITVAA
jgi:NADPH:quinone reductase-like Zn-dependent oxidoreductase